MEHYDVVIVGGGPAGSTVGTLVKGHAPDLRVLLLERARFPRHHVGESLLAGGTPVLREMGVFDAVNGYGFPEKLGATYVWGRERKPWGFEFDDVIARLVAQGKRLPELYTKAWQVRRGGYDHILLRHAADMGVQVREGARVRRPVVDRSSGRVTGVEYTDEGGARQVGAALTIDCTGQDGLLARAFRLRDYDPRMNNYALWGYWRGARWKVEYVGHPNLTRIFVATTPRGWIWYIPVSRDVVSVGLVTNRRVLRGLSGGPRALYSEELRSCGEIDGLLEGAYPVRITPDQRDEICAVQDWSYTSRQLAGPGSAMVGDAAGFVDPILSSGVMLAHELGQKAAYTINSSLNADSDGQAREYWDFYQRTYRTYLQAYRDMAAFWYSNNFSAESWWWEAQRSVSANLSAADLTDLEAFVRIASGYATRAESISLFGSYPVHEARKLVDGLFGASADSAAAGAGHADRRLRLRRGVAVTVGLYFYGGRIRRTRRVLNRDSGDYLDLHPGEEVLVARMDGAHTVGDLDRLAAGINRLEQRLPVRTGTELAVQLDDIGALEPAAG